MQSHSSRHCISDHLRDRHPDSTPAEATDIIPTEIAVAYSRRAVPKLVDVMRLEDGVLSDEELAHCLRVFNELLSDQEAKADAIACEAGKQLTRHARSTVLEVQQLCCRGLTCLAKTMVGRFHCIESEAIEVMCSVLPSCPVEATECLLAISQGQEGILAIMDSPAGVVATITDGVIASKTHSPPAALANAVNMVARVVSVDRGIMQALEAHVPAAVVALADHTTQGALRGSLGRTARIGCADVMRHLCHHPWGKVQLLEPFPGDRPVQATTVLGRMLASPDLPVRKRAAQALMGLSVEPQAKLPVANECGDLLIGMMKDATGLLERGAVDLEMLENARDALLNCAEHPRFRTDCAIHFNKQEWDLLVGDPAGSNLSMSML